MTNDTTPQMTLRRDVVEAVSKKIITEIVNDQSISVHEMLHVIGNVCYSIGASLNGYKGRGPNVEQLKQEYINDPENLGTALMLNGLTIQTWTQDIRVEE